VLKVQYARDMSQVLTDYWLRLSDIAIEVYKDNIPDIFTDSKIIFDTNISQTIKNKLSKKITDLNKLYRGLFNKLPIFYMNKVSKKTTLDVENSIAETVPEDLQFLVVKLNEESQRALIAKDAVIRSNIELITGIDEEMQNQVHKTLQESLMRGRDIDYMKDELSKIHGAKFSEKRIKLIARDQIDKATQVINHAVLADLGLTQAIWKHSKISRVPRKSHLRANNTVYDIDKGCEIDGEFIYPAQLPGCNCYSGPFIPGISSTK
jgi:uncharacterized protein with gpF-like domain